MVEMKTKPTGVSVDSFLDKVEGEQLRADCATLVKLIGKITGKPAYMWGPSIVGFDTYRYKYASGHECDAPVAGFSPRKNEFSIYLTAEGKQQEALLAKLGKHRMAKACLYVKRLSDIDMDVLEKLIAGSVTEVKRRYG